MDYKPNMDDNPSLTFVHDLDTSRSGLRELKIGICGPFEVRSYCKSAVRDLESLDEIAGLSKWRIETSYWEDLTPRVGRPQDQINKQVIAGADVFLGIVGGTLGRVGKDGASFFEEEYEYARNCCFSKGLPMIWLFRKTCTELERERQEREVARVDAFFREIEDRQEVLYARFGSLEDLFFQLHKSVGQFLKEKNETSDCGKAELQLKAVSG